MRKRLDALLTGPHPRLPRPLDAVSEWWWALRPRVRTVATVLALIVLALAVQHRVRAAEARWGGVPRTAYVATQDLPVGAGLDAVRRVRLPPLAVPASATADLPRDAVLALALPEGAVLTDAHLDVRGPAAGLAGHLRAVPVPTEEGWSVVVGGWVDVWVLGTGSEPASLVARSRPVLDVREDPRGTTALIGMAATEVGRTTEGLALGRVLLTHAPAPRPDAGGPSD